MAGPSSIPFIKRDAIFAAAENLVERCHPSFAAPIPVEAIVERDFNLEIIVLDRLKATIGCPAYTSWSARQICVDRRMFERELGWYHFSLAHELGHLILHPQLFLRSCHRTRAEYEAFRAGLSEEDRVKMEQQAQLFAGAFMAPSRTVTDVADECVELARQEGVLLTRVVEVDWPYIMKGMADRLEVNEQTVDIRFKELGLIDRYF